MSEEASPESSDLPIRPPQPANRKAATQARILEAAIALFSARGFDRTSVSAIAQRAGVSHSAVFWHFGDKTSLFEEAFRAMLVPFIEELKQPPVAEGAEQRFFGLFDVYEQFVTHHADRIATIVRWMMESRALRRSIRKPLFSLHDRFEAQLRTSLEELECSPERAAELAAGLIALLDGSLLLALLNSDAQQQQRSVRGVRALAELALSGAAGSKVKTNRKPNASPRDDRP